MKKWSICRLAVILILSIQNDLVAQSLSLVKTTQLSHYSSASTLEFYGNQLYVIGDDAPQLLILNKDHDVVDSVSLFESSEARIGKDEKADIEASVLINEQNKNYLLAFSSFSTEKRNKTLLLDFDNKNVRVTNVQFNHLPLQEINIEGAAWINGHLLLSNRANNTNKVNQIILTGLDTSGSLAVSDDRIVTLLLPEKKSVTGISGLAYLKEKDLLLFTASTENTTNAYSDGAIGESFIGYVVGISDKLTNKEISADKLFGLSNVLASKNPQKIESVTIEESKGNEVTLHLAADNDNGRSTLFKVKMVLEK